MYDAICTGPEKRNPDQKIGAECKTVNAMSDRVFHGGLGNISSLASSVTELPGGLVQAIASQLQISVCNRREGSKDSCSEAVFLNQNISSKSHTLHQTTVPRAVVRGKRDAALWPGVTLGFENKSTRL